MNDSISQLDPNRLQRSKFSYTTRRIPQESIATLITGNLRPQSGELVLARVSGIGQHTRLERPDGRRCHLFIGDEIVVSYGHRYAPDQFEAVVPDNLAPCHLVAAGGVAGNMLNRHRKMKIPTHIKPLGLLGDVHGRRLNLNNFKLPSLPKPATTPLTLAVVGSSMNSGKTTTVANLIHGFTKLGMRVGAAKVTGTGAGCDYWKMKDAGAKVVFDFIDAGFSSTYKASLVELAEITETLIDNLAHSEVDIRIIEIADGLFQQETAALLSLPGFASLLDCILFASADSMGADAGVRWLQQKGLPVIAVSGVVTSSPLAAREIEAAIRLPVYPTPSLTKRATVETILDTLAARTEQPQEPLAQRSAALAVING